jgi:TIR domain
MNPKVFLSHASEDKDRFVLAFAMKLREKGIDVWLDKWEILPGDSLVDKIFEEGIKNAQAIIVVLSNYSVDKAWVKEELNAAVVKRIDGISKLIPVLIDDCEVPEALRSTVWVKIGNLSAFDSEVDSIVRAIFEHRESPALGKPPAYATSSLDIITGLTRIDSLVLKLACERAISNAHTFVGDMEALYEIVKALDVPEEEFYESLEILHSRGYILGRKVLNSQMRNRIQNLTITLFGFEEYAKTYVENYGALVDSVALQIVNLGQRGSLEISESLGQPLMIVNHILDLLDANQMIRVLKTSGSKGNVYISDVTAELKRRLRESGR